MSCLSENTLRAYHDGELDARERSTIEQHVANCAQCEARYAQIAASASRVRQQMISLGGGAAESSIDPLAALSQFKAQHQDVMEDNTVEDKMAAPQVAEGQHESFLARMFGRRWRLAWVSAVAATIIFGSLAFPAGRSFAQRLLATLRIEKVQPVRLDFSALDGNRPLQEMFAKCSRDKVVVTAKEKSQPADSASSASSSLASR